MSDKSNFNLINGGLSDLDNINQKINNTQLEKMTLFLQKLAQLSKNDLIKTSKEDGFILFNDVYRLLIDVKENNVDSLIRIGKDFEKANYYYNAFLNAILLEKKDKNKNQILSLCNNLNRNNQAIDLYLPLDSINIETATKDLFHYLDNQNIKSNSKIMSQIRNDNIAISVADIETALKIINYVNTSDKLKGKIVEANPFMFNYGNVEIVFDGDSSYNVALSYYIAEYIDTLKKQNNLDSANSKNFNNHLKKNFEINKYQNIIIQQIISLTEGKTGIKDLINFCNIYFNKNYKFNLEEIKGRNNHIATHSKNI